MKIRTKLILAFLTLAALPLLAVVLFNYRGTSGVFRRAVEAETSTMAESLVQQLEAVRDDLDRRLQGLGNLPLESLIAPDEVSGEELGQVYAELMAQIDEVSAIVESFEYTPVESSADAAPVAGADRTFVIYPSRTLAAALRRMQEKSRGLQDLGVYREYLVSTLAVAVKDRERMSPEEIAALRAREEQARAVLGTEFTSPVLRRGEVVGHIRAQVRTIPIIRQILEGSERREEEVPFAIGGDRQLYTATARDRELLEEEVLVVSETGRPGHVAGWIMAEAAYPDSELDFYIARPVGAPLQDLRETAMRSFGSGMLAVGLALIGIALLSRRLTRHLGSLTAGAESLATGDLETRVPVRSNDELGRLASTFNRMAEELQDQQTRLLEQEVQQRLLEAENQRKGRELEEARQLQLSMLPKGVPDHPLMILAARMRTATEVGGDYYDFLVRDDGALVAAIGDATGHGARPGTLVTVVKGLFSAGAADRDLTEFLGNATRTIRSMELGRMQMALTVVRVDQRRISMAAAGMPPALLHRRSSLEVEEIALQGMPLGGLADFVYRQWQTELEPGDTLLLMTDGFPELLNRHQDPLGYDRVREIFAGAAAQAPDEIITQLSAAADAWRGTQALEDDITFVVLRAR